MNLKMTVRSIRFQKQRWHQRIFYQWNDGKVCFCDRCAVLVESWNDEDHVVDEHPREEKEPNEVGPYVDRLIV